jgi:hypothetical protein
MGQRQINNVLFFSMADRVPIQPVPMAQSELDIISRKQTVD